MLDNHILTDSRIKSSFDDHFHELNFGRHESEGGASALNGSRPLNLFIVEHSLIFD
jgi:hypothetical protein